mmetsp:Transcript_18039/g.20482  ORF Transcript_18039/g.20482 Transcript_18039/m.20482 type:complete len:242 (+) Transcript_18039:665-1390(+)
MHTEQAEETKASVIAATSSNKADLTTSSSSSQVTSSEDAETPTLFQCPRSGCSKMYSRLYSLRRHLRSSHNLMKKYSCQQCNKKFALPQYYREHMYIHTGEKPYVCDFPGCGQGFRQAGKRALHKRRDHGGQLLLAKKVNSTELLRKISEEEKKQQESSAAGGDDCMEQSEVKTVVRPVVKIGPNDQIFKITRVEDHQILHDYLDCATLPNFTQNGQLPAPRSLIAMATWQPQPYCAANWA